MGRSPEDLRFVPVGPAPTWTGSALAGEGQILEVGDLEPLVAAGGQDDPTSSMVSLHWQHRALRA